MRASRGIGARIILELFGTFNKFAVSRFYSAFIKDRAEFQKSIERVLSHDFENIIVSHGENVIGNAKAVLKEALAQRGLQCA